MGDPQDKDKISQLTISNEMKNDFIIWLIEESGELDYTNYAELWERFNKYLNENENK